LKRKSLRLVVGMLLAAGGCGSTKSCKQGTLLVTVTFDGTTAVADDVEVNVTVAGGAPKETTLVHKSGMTSGSIEIDFPVVYPQGQRVDVTVVALNDGATLGTTTGTVQSLAAGCGTLALAISGGAFDGGMGGNGAAGRAGTGGTTAGGTGGSAHGGTGGSGAGGEGTAGSGAGGAGTGGSGAGGAGTAGSGAGGAGTGGTGTAGSVGTGGTGGGGTGGSGAGGAGTGGSGTGGAGTGGAGGTCTNACTNGATQCLSDSSLQTCAAGGNGCRAWTTSACPTTPTVLVCERPAPAGCVDPNWAEWPMPNGPADVATGAPNAESYAINADGTVTDNVTGLMWQRTVPIAGTTPTTFTLNAAVAYCPTLTLGGYNDWRLPTVVELVSIVDYSVATPGGPTINATAFPGTPGNYFWSSSPLAGAAGFGWLVFFDNGMTVSSGDGLPDANYVRCVR
jgi:Protein of unknown function (DUF1566)